MQITLPTFTTSPGLASWPHPSLAARVNLPIGTDRRIRQRLRSLPSQRCRARDAEMGSSGCYFIRPVNGRRIRQRIGQPSPCEARPSNRNRNSFEIGFLPNHFIAFAAFHQCCIQQIIVWTCPCRIYKMIPLSRVDHAERLKPASGRTAASGIPAPSANSVP